MQGTLKSLNLGVMQSPALSLSQLKDFNHFDKNNLENVERKSYSELLEDFRAHDRESELLLDQLLDEKLSILNQNKDTLEDDKLLDQLRSEYNLLEKKESILKASRVPVNIKKTKKIKSYGLKALLTNNEAGRLNNVRYLNEDSLEFLDNEEIENFLIVHATLPVSAHKIRDMNPSEQEVLIHFIRENTTNISSPWIIHEIRSLDGKRLVKENLNHIPLRITSAFEKKYDCISSENGKPFVDFLVKNPQD